MGYYLLPSLYSGLPRISKRKPRCGRASHRVRAAQQEYHSGTPGGSDSRVELVNSAVTYHILGTGTILASEEWFCSLLSECPPPCLLRSIYPRARVLRSRRNAADVSLDIRT